MKKSIVSLALVLALALSMFGGVFASAETGTIEFWNFFTGPDGENMKNLVEGFNATNPAYKINNVTMASGDLYQKIPTVVNSGKGIPDLCIVDVARIPMFQSQGLLESVDVLATYQPEIKKENYRDAVWSTGTIDGVQYSIPLDMGVCGMAYNKDLVEKYAAGVLDDNVVTVDELMQIIPKASADGIITLPVSFFTYEIAIALAAQKGAYVFKDDGVTPNLDAPEFAEAYEVIKSIQEQGGGSVEGDDNLQMFINGQVIFCEDGVWDANAINKNAELNWGLTNSLAYSPEKIANFSNSNQFVLLKSEERTNEKEQVIASFLNYVRENALEWARSGQVPASNAADDNDEFKAMKQHFFVSSPEVQESINFRSYKYGGILDDAVWGVHSEAVFGRMPVADMLAQAQQQTIDNIAQQK